MSSEAGAGHWFKLQPKRWKKSGHIKTWELWRTGVLVAGNSRGYFTHKAAQNTWVLSIYSPNFVPFFEVLVQVEIIAFIVSIRKLWIDLLKRNNE